MGEAFERCNSLTDECCDPFRDRRILLADALNDADKIVGGFWRPAELHLRAKHPFDAGYHLTVRQELSAVKLIQAFFYFLPKPAVMVQVMLDQFPDVFIRAALILRSDAIQLGFQLGGEVNFHAPRLPLGGPCVNGKRV
jgi:hypothetical protein